ncbi:unnamed protein product, partial [Didymodactylos carnosus]
INSLPISNDRNIIVPVSAEKLPHPPQQENPTLKTLRNYLKRKQSSLGGCYSDMKRLRLSTNTTHQEEPCIT